MGQGRPVRPAVQGYGLHVVPGQGQTGAGRLQRAEPGQNVQRFVRGFARLLKTAGQSGAYAVQQRIAVGQHHATAALTALVFQRPQRGFQGRDKGDDPGPVALETLEQAPGQAQSLGPAQSLRGRRSQRSVQTQADYGDGGKIGGRPLRGEDVHPRPGRAVGRPACFARLASLIGNRGGSRVRFVHVQQSHQGEPGQKVLIVVRTGGARRVRLRAVSGEAARGGVQSGQQGLFRIF